MFRPGMQEGADEREEVGIINTFIRSRETERRVAAELVSCTVLKELLGMKLGSGVRDQGSGELPFRDALAAS